MLNFYPCVLEPSLCHCKVGQDPLLGTVFWTMGGWALNWSPLIVVGVWPIKPEIPDSDHALLFKKTHLHCVMDYV